MPNTDRALLCVLKWEGEFPTLVPMSGGLWRWFPVLHPDDGLGRPFLGTERLVLVDGGGPDGLYAPAEWGADGRLIVGWPKCLREAEPGIWGRLADQPVNPPILKGGVR